MCFLSWPFLEFFLKPLQQRSTRNMKLAAFYVKNLCKLRGVVRLTLLPISRHSQKNLIFWDWIHFFSSWMREVKPNVFALKCCLTWALCCQHDLVNLSLKLWTGVGFSECFDVKSSFMWEKAMWILALKSHLARCNKTVRIPVMGWAALSHQEIMIAQQHKLSDTWAKNNFSNHHGLINISVCNTFVFIHRYTKQPPFSFNLHNTCIWDGKHWVWSQRVYRVIKQEYTQCFQKRKIRYGFHSLK